MKTMIVPVILSGGSGTRLWPFSRAKRPKQFINLIGDSSLFQQTLERLDSLPNVQAPIVVCNEDHRFTVAEQMLTVGVEKNAIMLEAVGRNTAAAVAAAAVKLENDNASDALMLVLPADHLIKDVAAFALALEKAAVAANNGELMTFGIKPTAPATGFGYIKASQMGNDVSKVAQFCEKPDFDTAQEFVQSGQYYWNSGMFLFSVKSYLAELNTHAPAILEHVRNSVQSAKVDLDFFRLQQEAYAKCEDTSIDYAVMEKSHNVSVVPLDAGWSDIGSWSALWDACDKDENNNYVKGDVILENTHNCFVKSTSRLVTTLDVENLIIVDTDDALMVSTMDADQDIKKLVNKLKDANRKEAEAHRMDFRPWGSFDCLDLGERFQVKRLMVKPGQSISMQKHHHRAEHWIVVSGTAEVTLDDDVITLSENESVYIPLGSKHRLANPGKIPLEIIEVQSGSYLGEDDIVRYDDIYGRA